MTQIITSDMMLSAITKSAKSMPIVTLRVIAEFLGEIASCQAENRTGRVTLEMTYSQGGINGSVISCERRVK